MAAISTRVAAKTEEENDEGNRKLDRVGSCVQSCGQRWAKEWAARVSDESGCDSSRGCERVISLSLCGDIHHEEPLCLSSFFFLPLLLLVHANASIVLVCGAFSPRLEFEDSRDVAKAGGRTIVVGVPDLGNVHDLSSLGDVRMVYCSMARHRENQR